MLVELSISLQANTSEAIKSKRIVDRYVYQHPTDKFIYSRLIQPIVTTESVQSVLFNIRNYSQIVFIYRRQGKGRVAKESTAFGVPRLCGSPAPFICYILLAIPFPILLSCN